MAMNIRNTFPKPSTRFALLSTLFFFFPACRWCAFKASRARSCVCLYRRRVRIYEPRSPAYASVSDCHLGDEKLAQANFTAFIFILLVTRPSASYPAPHREGEEKNSKQGDGWTAIAPTGLVSLLTPPPNLTLQHSEGQR